MSTAIRVLACWSVLIAGCAQSALLQIRHENLETERRITAQEQELRTLEDQRGVLFREQKKLLLELDTQHMTLNELQAKLEDLRQQNARLKADTEDQQKKRDGLDLQIRKYQAEINGLQSNDRLSTDEKRKRIDDLQRQIKAHLELMMTL